MGKLIDIKPTVGLVDIKPSSASLLNVKPNMGFINRQTEDQRISILHAGMSIGPGFFMFLTYPVSETIVIT